MNAAVPEQIPKIGISPMQNRVHLGHLGTFSTIGVFCAYLLVPSLPTINVDMEIDLWALQFVVSLYLLGFAFGQLLFGYASDHYGRRAALICGCVMFTFFGALGVISQTAIELIVSRFFQGVAGASGTIIARAHVQDTTCGPATTSSLARLNLMASLTLALAPLLGGFLQSIGGWKFVLGFMTLQGLAVLCCAVISLKETRKSEMSQSGLLIAYGQLLRTDGFFKVAVSGALITTCIYAMNVSLPTILLEEYSMDKVVPPFVLSGFVGAMMVGSMLTARQATKWPRHRSIVGGTIMILVISSLLLACSLLLHSPEVALALLFAFACTVGFVSPIALASAIGTTEGHVGLAAGSYGAVQMATGSLFAVLAGLLEYRLVGIASLLFLSAAVSLLLQVTRPEATLPRKRTA